MKVFNIRHKIIEAIREQCNDGDIIMYAPNGNPSNCGTGCDSYSSYAKIKLSEAGILCVNDYLLNEASLCGIDFENPRFVLIGNIKQSIEEIKENILNCDLFALNGRKHNEWNSDDNELESVIDEMQLQFDRFNN